MKNWIACIAALTCLLGMAACAETGDTGILKPDILATEQPVVHSCKPFAEYLDSKNFIVGCSQKDLISQAESYTYNGKTVSEHVPGAFWDGPDGGGLDMTGELFGFSNSFTASGDNADYANRFYTTVPLEGLALPYDITFADTLSSALEKMGMEANSVDLAATQNSPVTLCKEDTSFLRLTDFASQQVQSAVTEGSDDAHYAWELKYTQTYQTLRNDGRTTNVTRIVSLCFREDGKLGLFEISVREKYKLDRSNE